MRLATAPLWMWALAHGTLVTVAGLVLGLELGDLTRERVLVALASGALAGPLLGATARRAARRTRATLGAAVPELAVLDDVDRAQAERAARRGPVPRQPRVRAAAAAVARHRLVESETTRTAGLVFSIVLGTVQAVVAVAITPVAWVLVAVFVWLAVDAVLAPPRRAARLAVLEPDASPATLAAGH